jgi:hypothetical protein
MAPVHRLAIELSDQRAAARDLYKYTIMELKKRRLKLRITAKRFSATALIASDSEKLILSGISSDKFEYRKD